MRVPLMLVGALTVLLPHAVSAQAGDQPPNTLSNADRPAGLASAMVHEDSGASGRPALAWGTPAPRLSGAGPGRSRRGRPSPRYPFLIP